MECWRIRVDGRFAAVHYRDILENIILPSVQEIFANNFVFQQDNSPVHTAMIVRQWMS
ncbi:unnamed protein product, partial [Tenebrio molitor]